ncbi:MAG: stalk domain-containing protein [Bacillota bacterium]
MARQCVALWWVGGLLLGLLAAGTPQATADSQGVRVTLDGVEVPLDVPGEIRDGRTLVPFRAIFEALGASVEWDAPTRTVTAVKGTDSLKLTVDSAVVEWRRSLITVDVPPVIVDGRTLVPLRFVGQALGLHVSWDGAARTVHLETEPENELLGQGIHLVHAKSCMVCHRIHGVGGQIGPVLNGVTDRYSEEWLRVWLRNPQAVRDGSRMPNFQFTEEEISAVLEYLRTLN